jgi:hypothetical protein
MIEKIQQTQLLLLLKFRSNGARIGSVGFLCGLLGSIYSPIHLYFMDANASVHWQELDWSIDIARLAIAVVFFAVSITVVLGVHDSLVMQESYVFDKLFCKLIYEQRRVLTRHRTYIPINEIAQVEIGEAQFDGDRIYRIQLILNSHKSIFIGSSICIHYWNNYEEIETLVNQIKEFLSEE